MTMFCLKRIWFLGIGLILIIIPPFLPPYWVTLTTQMLIYGIMAMSLDILLGYTGLPSFGHAGFFGTSAYAVAILVTRYEIGFWLSSLGGVVSTTIIAAVFGLMCSHLSGLFFAIITLALGMCLWGLAFRWVSMTGGDSGISGIIRPDIGLRLNLDNPLTYYYLTFVIFALALFCMYILVKSPFGQSLKGIRESESRMRALGYNIWLHKYLSFVIAATFAGVAGVLWTYFNGFVSPTDLDVMATMEAFFMAIMGGPGTLIGPALGAGIITFLKNFISAYTHRWLIILGCTYIIIILYAPDGIVNLIVDFSKNKFRRKSSLSEKADKVT